MQLNNLIKESLSLFQDLVAKNVDMRDHTLSVDSLLLGALINFGRLVSKFCSSVELFFDLGARSIQGVESTPT